MSRQAALYPAEKVPIILPFLAQGILALGGPETEGLFRIPGDSDQVAMVKDRIDRGRYELDDIDDVHVCGSLFKLWLRELQEPLIPGDRYATALTCVCTSQVSVVVHQTDRSVLSQSIRQCRCRLRVRPQSASVRLVSPPQRSVPS